MGAEAVEYMITKKHSKIKLTISVLVHIPCKYEMRKFRFNIVNDQ